MKPEWVAAQSRQTQGILKYFAGNPRLDEHVMHSSTETNVTDIVCATGTWFSLHASATRVLLPSLSTRVSPMSESTPFALRSTQKQKRACGQTALQSEFHTVVAQAGKANRVCSKAMEPWCVTWLSRTQRSLALQIQGMW